MARRTTPLLMRLRPRAGAHRRLVALTLVVLLATVAAPAWSAMRNECDLCPPSCPMHHHGSSPAGANHLHCHGAGTGAAQAQRIPSGHSLMSRTTCGNHALVSATVLPPAILTAAPAYDAVLVESEPSTTAQLVTARGIEPPDTPPPIPNA
jgi:hypothetical protein